MNNMVRDVLSQHTVNGCFTHEGLNFPLRQTDFCRDFRKCGTALQWNCRKNVEVVDALLGGIVEALGTRLSKPCLIIFQVNLHHPKPGLEPLVGQEASREVRLCRL